MAESSKKAAKEDEKKVKAKSKGASNMLAGIRLKRIIKLYAVILVLAAVVILQHGVRYPFLLTISFLDQATFTTKVHAVASLNSSLFVAALLLTQAVVYFVISTTGFGSFLKGITKGSSRFRWLNYAMTNSVMLMLCAIAAGFGDIVQLMLMLVVVTAISGFGYINEVINLRRKRIVWDDFNIMSWIMLIFSVSIVLALLLGSIYGASEATALTLTPLSLYLLFQVSYMSIIHKHYAGKSRFKSAVKTEAYLLTISTIYKLAIATLVILNINLLV